MIEKNKDGYYNLAEVKEECIERDLELFVAFGSESLMTWFKIPELCITFNCKGQPKYFDSSITNWYTKDAEAGLEWKKVNPETHL